MRIIVNPHKCEIDRTLVNEKEINVSKCEFVFSEEIPSDYVKEAYFTLNGTTYKKLLFNNECDIPHEVLETKGTIEIGVVAYEIQNEQYVKRFNPSPCYQNTLVGSLKDEFENSEEVTPTDKEQIIGALNDGLDRIDNAVEDVNIAIEEANNLDLDVSKEGKVATVTLTKKDASTKVVTLSDGTSLMFNWEGTRLGIKTDEETEYTYVDLQGIQGPIGPKGEAFTIKKTYPSVEVMNADFNNMQLGDYVMIASAVEVEDNAKLYTRGEERWIFISDFSGAQGIRGETGLTPNIQIGTVVTGQTSSVTRTGTNENPILNFVLEKGETGATGETGPTGATGNGIATIQKTSSEGLIDTYTITYTNGNTTTFQITNGEDGEVTETELNVVRTDVDDLRRNQLMDTKTGSNINVDDAFDTRIMEGKMSKESTQDGTPTPENPVEVKTVKGSVGITITDGTNTRNYTIPLGGNEIAGIGDYKDELIVDKNGHCWLNKKLSKKIFTENDNWVRQSVYTNNTRYVLNDNNVVAIPGTPILSNYFLKGKGGTDTTNIAINGGNGWLMITIPNTIALTLEDFKNWLQTKYNENNPVYALYVTTTSQLIDLNYTVDLTLFKGVNNISNSDDMDMTITYVQDINMIIDNLINGQAL